MSTKNIAFKIVNILFWGILICYLLFMAQLLFWRTSGLMPRRLNIVPFRSIMEGINVFDGIRYRLIDMQVWGNVAIFIPAGIYLMVFHEIQPVKNTIIHIVLISFCVEIIQYVFNIGGADIDDIILNCLGGLIGIGLYLLLKRIFKTRDKTKTAITIMSALLGIPVVIIVAITFVTNYF